MLFDPPRSLQCTRMTLSHSIREVQHVTMQCNINVPTIITHHITNQVIIMTPNHLGMPIMFFEEKLNFALPGPDRPERIQLSWLERRVSANAAAASILASSGTSTRPEACSIPTGKPLTAPCSREPWTRTEEQSTWLLGFRDVEKMGRSSHCENNDFLL